MIVSAGANLAPLSTQTTTCCTLISYYCSLQELHQRQITQLKKELAMEKKRNRNRKATSGRKEFAPVAHTTPKGRPEAGSSFAGGESEASDAKIPGSAGVAPSRAPSRLPPPPPPSGGGGGGDDDDPPMDISVDTDTKGGEADTVGMVSGSKKSPSSARKSVGRLSL